MLDLFMENLSLFLINRAVTGGFEVSSGLVIVFLGILALLVVVIINQFIRYSVNARKLTKEKEDNTDLKERVVSLEKKQSDTSNENVKLKSVNDELTSSNVKLKKLAYYDKITDLPNRIPFIELLDSVMLTLREGETIGLFLINIDNFKLINSRLGTSYGDELLIDVAHRLKQVIDENDYLARIGGDDFIILSQNIHDANDYEDKLKRILNVFSYPFSLSTEERFISVSIGATIAPRDGNNSATLLKNANVAMRNVKARGKNGYMYFDESMNEAITQKIQIQSELRNAFENNEFDLYYEPVISLEDNKIKGFDVIICWNHPTRGVIHPDEFISHVKETGFIVPIGVWAFKEACKVLKMWQDNGYADIELYYNVTEPEFKEPEFISTIWDIVSKSEVEPNYLILEITETTALDNIKNTISTIDKLGELGIKFGLDKFGTNYNSIRYLDKLDVTYVKLGKRVLKSAMESIDKQRVLETMVKIIKIYDFDVVAQGIEASQEEMFLKYVGSDMAEGPYYHKPISKEKSIKLLEQGYIKNRNELDVSDNNGEHN